jgi:hypothetical protein
MKELINKCWMTHDGMWFYHCLQELGMEKTNHLNKAANRSLAHIEIKRIMKAFGLGEVRNHEDLENMAACGFQVVKGDFMNFNFHFPARNLMRFDMGEHCFALDGMRRLGVEKEYECGVFNRVEGWFEALGLKYKVTPQVLKCMMLSEGKCYREYRFDFGDE